MTPGPPPNSDTPLLVPYREAMSIQDRLVVARRAGGIDDLVWALEHPRTITFGTQGGETHLRFDAQHIEARGFEIVASRRGGDVTCHEPGQLIAYPVVSLSGGAIDRDLHAYLRALEEAVIRLLATFGLHGRRVEGRTGVWLLDGGPPRKIAAMGIRCTGWVTSHGVAFNVRNDLEGFDSIVPCGISDAGVTSLAGEIDPGDVPDLGEVGRRFHTCLEETLARPLRLVFGPSGAEALLASR